MEININSSKMVCSLPSIVYCSNCGKYGHLYKRCNQPIISLGIISFKIIDNKCKFLLIKRKDSLSYVELIRGKYTLDKINYINKLFNYMTIDEKNIILKSSFDDLWSKLWIGKTINKYKNEYDFSKEKFNKLKEGYNYIDSSNNLNFISIETIIKNSTSSYLNPEWGFPKGRRNIRETDLECSKREFIEETGLTKYNFSILYNIKPIEEIYSGTNSVRYKHIYYLAQINKNIEVELNYKNYNQIAEVSEIGFFDYEECLEKIREYNVEKKQALQRAYDCIKKILNLN
jgi:ADP-ribose pyrophosphatase YjhB (NUDIX family)